MRVIILLLFVVTSLFFSAYINVHESYVSITTITHNKETKSFEIEIKLTAHDIEKALLNKGDLKLGSAKELTNADDILSNYINNQLKIWINGGKTSLQFVGKEVNLDETLYLFFECKTPRVLNTIKIENRILQNTFPLQENITYINTKGIKKSYTFQRSNHTKEFSLK